MDNITKEIDELAEKMEKSTQKEIISLDILKSTISRMGAENLKKALTTLQPEQVELLKEVIADMRKSHAEPIQHKQYSLEPVSNSTNDGDYLFNEDVKPPQTERDEDLDKEAIKRKQMEHRNQGGVPLGSDSWEGQVIKSEKEKEDTYEMPKKEAVKEHVQLVDVLESKDHKDDKEEAKKQGKELKEIRKPDDKDVKKADSETMDMGDLGIEKGGAGSGRKPLQSGMAGLESVKRMRQRADETAEVQSKFGEKKKKLKGMVKRMQERGMKKSECVAALAKSFEVDADKIDQVWEIIAKGDVLPEKGNAEGSQVAVPVQMKSEEKGKVLDSEDPSVPKYKEKSAKQTGSDGKPMSGDASETADQSMKQVPETMGHKGDMKKSDGFWHVEEEVYMAKSAGNPFAERTIKPNAHYTVDSYIELQAASEKQRLAKSTFDYQTEDYMAKSNDPADQDPTQGVVASNAKKQAEAKKEDADEIRNIKISEKLSRIEGKHGPKMPFVKGKAKPALKKSVINDLIEKGLDMDAQVVETAQRNMNSEAQGGFLVKSFSDEDMDVLFQESDMYRKQK